MKEDLGVEGLSSGSGTRALFVLGVWEEQSTVLRDHYWWGSPYGVLAIEPGVNHVQGT